VSQRFITGVHNNICIVLIIERREVNTVDITTKKLFKVNFKRDIPSRLGLQNCFLKQICHFEILYMYIYMYIYIYIYIYNSHPKEKKTKPEMESVMGM